MNIKYVIRLSIFIIVVLAIGFGGILPIGIAYIYVTALVDHACANRTEPMSTRLSNPEGIEAFTFSPENEDFALDGWFAPGTNGAGIIILPGSWGGSNTMYEEMEILHQAGYSVMTYDTRSCADPEQRTSLGYTEVKDLQAAIDWMSQRSEVDPGRIGVFGHSMGGATAIYGAAKDERIKAMIATGNYGDMAADIRNNMGNEPGLFERWQRGWVVRFFEWKTGVDMDSMRPISVIGEISPRPVLLVHGSLEIEGTRGYEQFNAAGEPKELWIVEGSAHGGYIAAAPEEYARRITEFFNRYLLDQ